MTDKLEVGQLRIWKDWTHVDSVFVIVELSHEDVCYKYTYETDGDFQWRGSAAAILINTMPYTKLHKLLMGMTDNE